MGVSGDGGSGGNALAGWEVVGGGGWMTWLLTERRTSLPGVLAARFIRARGGVSETGCVWALGSGPGWLGLARARAARSARRSAADGGGGRELNTRRSKRGRLARRARRTACNDVHWTDLLKTTR